MRLPLKANLMWLILVIAFVGAYRILSVQRELDRGKGWGELIQLVEGHKGQKLPLERLSIQGQKVTGVYKSDYLLPITEVDGSVSQQSKGFVTIGPPEGIGEAFISAVEDEKQELVECIAAKDGFDINYRDMKYGKTGLMKASDYNHHSIALVGCSCLEFLSNHF